LIAHFNWYLLIACFSLCYVFVAYHSFAIFGPQYSLYSSKFLPLDMCIARGTPAQRNRDAPCSSPEIEEKSSGIRHCLAYKKSALYYNLYWVQGDSDIIGNYIGMATLRLPWLLYASSRTTRSSGIISSSRISTTVMNSTPQGLWLECLS